MSVCAGVQGTYCVKQNGFMCAVGCQQPREKQVRSGKKISTRFCCKITRSHQFPSGVCPTSVPHHHRIALSWHFCSPNYTGIKAGICSKSLRTVWGDLDSGVAKCSCAKHICRNLLLYTLWHCFLLFLIYFQMDFPFWWLKQLLDPCPVWLIG